jgi:Na+-transporting methylmalonyl-CoA/oxaloacetate decarboxylase gamma subunit
MFDPIQFVNYLKYMGIGMLGVFIIIGIIITATYAIGKFTNKKQ